METKDAQLEVLVILIVVYILLFIFYPEKGNEAFANSLELLERILPLLILVLALTLIFHHLLPVRVIVDYMSKSSGIKKWIIAILAGLISVGSIYTWYPILRRLMEEGTSPGVVSAFLYARAIKLQYIPMLAVYFGVEYTIIVTAALIVASVVIGIIMNIIMEIYSYSVYER